LRVLRLTVSVRLAAIGHRHIDPPWHSTTDQAYSNRTAECIFS